MPRSAERARVVRERRKVERSGMRILTVIDDANEELEFIEEYIGM
jgi:hypothetical protein